MKWHWGRFSPRTSVSPANSHSTNCCTLIIIYQPRLIAADVPSGLSFTPPQEVIMIINELDISHCGELVSIPGDFMWDLWCSDWHWGSFSSSSVSLFLILIIPSFFYPHLSLPRKVSVSTSLSICSVFKFGASSLTRTWLVRETKFKVFVVRFRRYE
jgi:hypothetical protein